MLLYFLKFYCKENAVIFSLCRNSDLNDILSSIESLEEKFNKEYKYPYLLLNDVEFTEEFKQKVKEKVSTEIEFGKLNSEQWGYPPWIDRKKAEEGRKDLESKGIIYGGSESYRHMCRFFSGFFFDHDLIKKYDYYWRVEPGVKYFCKMKYDPFTFLKEKNKEYGFVISIKEFMETIPTLWDTTLQFITENRELIVSDPLKFMFDNNNYNGCHFWSNFEIGSLNFFRSKNYKKFFEFLDRKGGFYYERWGDAPVHSLAAAIFLGKDKIHFFDDIGYEHPPFMHCPNSPSRLLDCDCSPDNSIDRSIFSCLKGYINETQFD
ncbi:KTR mannosyltransferase [Tubulinosema ratisbonensis]|uniref:KTR mannosyltransferase n=1 Tax=Tubulinosema ratisbonensis TaxID=291195 RepID=A0A437AMK1_9MICR|nr:KTR mannosyltransferase [Tubulinosema ratisbonensis]